MCASSSTIKFCLDACFKAWIWFCYGCWSGEVWGGDCRGEKEDRGGEVALNDGQGPWSRA
jgi:hypothetical protein